MIENIDQIALRKWIEAGLAISEVRSLNGDAKYLLNNMIAKYTLSSNVYRLSEKAERYLLDSGYELTKCYRRNRFYGKNKLTAYEHAIPATIVRSELLKSSRSEDEVRSLLSRAGPVVIILREEDMQLNKCGLKSKMPNNWRWGDDELARYFTANIKLSDRVIRVEGAIKR